MITCGSQPRSFQSRGSSTAGLSHHGSRAGARTSSETSTTRRSDPGLRAEARDVETCRRDRGNHHPVRIALAVEALRVHEGEVTREPVDLPQEVRHRNGEAKVHERLGDLAVPDAKRPVARHAGHDAFAWMHDAEIVQTRDVEAV